MSSIRPWYTRRAIPALSQLTWVRSIASSASLCLTLLLLLISILPVASAENHCNSPEHVLSKQKSSRDWQLPTWLEFRTKERIDSLVDGQTVDGDGGLKGLVGQRALEEPAACGSVRKHLIRNGGMGWERKEVGKENRGVETKEALMGG
ncbi:hypothetical protein INR49_017953, partial [Caranx melampygus]